MERLILKADAPTADNSRKGSIAKGSTPTPARRRSSGGSNPLVNLNNVNSYLFGSKKEGNSRDRKSVV